MKKIKMSNERMRSKKVFAMLLAIVIAVGTMISVNTQEVNAADYCTKISGNYGSAKTFTVDTGKRFLLSDYIALKASAGKLKYWTIGIPRTKDIYGRYTIKIYDVSSKKAETKTWKDSKSIKIKLKKNRTYKITVTPIPAYAWADYNVKMQAREVTKNPTWTVYKTKGVNACR